MATMERFRGMRSKIAAPTDRMASAMKEGNRQIQNQRNFPKSASDLSSCTSGSAEEDSFTIELGPNSSNQGIGTPMKKLLAKEMSKEAEPKRRSPSVIARLMGFDGLPPQQPNHKQQKRRAETIERADVASTFYGSQLHRKKNSKEHEEFKDVYEVLVAPKGDSGRYEKEEQGTTNSKLTEAEKAFIQQKFMDAKRLSTDEKLQDSQEFRDALEILDSNKDLLLKFLQEPDYLFTKHLLDLQGVPPQTHCRHTEVSKPLNSLKYESNAAICKTKRGTSWKNDIRSPQMLHDDHFSHSYSKHDAHRSLQPSRIPFEGKVEKPLMPTRRKDEKPILPTRIVVLKPNLGRVQTGSKSNSSPRTSYDFLSDSGKHAGSMSARNKESELQGFNGMGFSRHKSRESREIAKEITRRMRNGITNGSMNFPSAGFRGYAGDESSCMSGNDSSSEPEETMLTSRNSFDRSSRYMPSSSHSTESSVSREARKRLSERWKMTRRFKEVGAVHRGSTLAEMLAISDREVRSENLDSMSGQDGCSDSFSTNDRTSGCASPLGISSMDGWKDGCVKHLSRSRSLPATSNVFGSPKTSLHREAQGDGWYQGSKEAMSWGRNRAIKRSIGPKEDLSSRNLKCSSKKSQSSRNKIREHEDTLQEIHFSHSEMKSDIMEKDPSEAKPMISETSTCYSTDKNLVDMIMEEQENTVMPSESPDELLQELSTCTFVEKVSSTHGLDHSIPQERSDGPSEESSVPLGPVPEPESPLSSKEAGQPSPVSVLEVTFSEDLSSSSECFERVSADLQGLRMQLQLLKLETDAYGEGSMLMSDEDAGVHEEKGILGADESWESSYIADVLVESGFDGRDPESFVAGWESSGCPLSPMIFEKLEKVYGDPTTGLKSDRKLVFDRVNSVLWEVFEQFVDPQPWVKKGVRSWWRSGRAESEIYKLLERQEKKKASDGVLEQEVETESEWVRLGEDVNAIGLEIESLVIEDLLDEIVSRKDRY